MGCGEKSAAPGNDTGMRLGCFVVVVFFFFFLRLPSRVKIMDHLADGRFLPRLGGGQGSRGVKFLVPSTPVLVTCCGMARY